MGPASAAELGGALLQRRRRLGRPLVMGIVNVTGDSFYPPSRAADEDAVALGLRLAEEGADLLDVGGESTRPGSDPVPAQEECSRVLPVVEQLARRLDVPVSVDTSKPQVAARALASGARVLNDVRALRAPGMLAEAVRFPLVILMHMLGESPKTMQEKPRYGDVSAEVQAFLAGRLEAFRAAGGDPAAAWVDPGIGFGKTVEHNLELMRSLGDLGALAPVLLGVSRKSFLGKILGGEDSPAPVEERLEASLAAACRAAQAGVACVRVHDVRATVRALDAWRRFS